MVDSMRIGIVGGVDRNAPALAGLARASGHELEHHTGVISGSASSLHLKALIGRSELVVVVTDVNSHNGVRTARREARLRQRPLKIVRRLGSSQFAALLESLRRRAA
jgi:hypothetical protein